MKDQRRFPRIKLADYSVEAKILGQKNSFPVSVLDLSASGMCMKNRSTIERDDHLFLLFPFKGQPYLMKGKAVWTNYRNTGVEFICTEEEMRLFADLFNGGHADQGAKNLKGIIVIPGYTYFPETDDSLDRALEIE